MLPVWGGEGSGVEWKAGAMLGCLFGAWTGVFGLYPILDFFFFLKLGIEVYLKTGQCSEHTSV